MIRRLSLRARLVLAVIVLAAAGLAAADAATYTSLQSFLFERTDQGLAAAEHSVEHELTDRGGPGGHGPGPGYGGDRAIPGAKPGDYFQLRSSNGSVLYEGRTAGYSDEAPPAPALPDDLASAAQYLTVPAASGSGRYRVHTFPSDGGLLVVHATPLDDVDGTLRQLLLIELLVTGGVLLALGGLSLWVVRIGLRPLDAIGSTASAIAAGDLSRRVEREDEKTEVGRLGLALNGMLGQIENAFNAQAASERKLRRFVADASHELRTPLAAVRAYAELFSRGASDRPADLERSMRGITRESERMSLLVEDLLLLARLDEGRPLERKTVDLRRLVSESVETAQTVEPERPIDLEADEALTVGDAGRLRQVVDNLLANIRAHTPALTPAHVRLSRNGSSVELTVADDGPGIDPAKLGHVFERFYRVDPSRARTSGGVGLGLSIVAAVVHAHGGSVAASSPTGGGATFTVTLPLAPKPAPRVPATVGQSRGVAQPG